MFYSALRNTLVCANIGIATDLAYGSTRHRVVTEEGELIESYGAMTGGGRKKCGLMGSKIV